MGIIGIVACPRHCVLIRKPVVPQDFQPYFVSHGAWWLVNYKSYNYKGIDQTREMLWEVTKMVSC